MNAAPKYIPIARREPKERCNDDGTFWFEYRAYYVRGASEWILEDRRVNSDGTYTGWRLWQRAATFRGVIYEGIGDSGFEHATSQHKAHAELVAKVRQDRKTGEAKYLAKLDYDRAVNEVNDFVRQCERDFDKAMRGKSGLYIAAARVRWANRRRPGYDARRQAVEAAKERCRAAGIAPWGN